MVSVKQATVSIGTTEYGECPQKGNLEGIESVNKTHAQPPILCHVIHLTI